MTLCKVLDRLLFKVYIFMVQVMHLPMLKRKEARTVSKKEKQVQI